MVCWGRDDSGQVGDGLTSPLTSPRTQPTQVLLSAGGTALSGIVQVTAGNMMTCARRQDGTGLCWGSNYAGQVGDGTTTYPRLPPTTVLVTAGGAALTGLAEIVLGPGADHTCGRKTDGSVLCWGGNGSGQIGDGTTTPRPSPTSVLTAPGGPALTGVAQIRIGNVHSCARKTDGTVLCWGSGGQVGDGTATARSSPTLVLVSPGGAALNNVAEIGVGNSHSCALKTDSTVLCWGYVNADGIVGDPATTATRNSPTLVRASPGGAALTGAVKLAVGANRTCAIKSDRTVVCWGANSAGQVGDGTTVSSRLSPTQVLVAPSGAPLTGIVEIAVGDNASWGGESACVRRLDNSVYCWGTNTSGQIGDGTTTSPRPSPTLVPTSPSCIGGGDGRFNCGPSGNEDCCASPLVTGGTFSRSYDGVTTGYTDPQYKATVSDFRLDKYEATVGRFRQYVSAVVAGWKPPAGSGKHGHLNGGNGLAASGGGYEAGWDVTNWSTVANFPTVKSTWDANLACDPTWPTWTTSAGSNEKKPINCITWFDAAAFCTWDGGFLPSEAEWNYAAAGGSEQRIYPWGSTAPGANTNLAIYNCYYNGTGTCTSVSNIAPVGSVAAGNGKWGQSDLAGGVWEWALDWYKSPYNETLCSNCFNIIASTDRVYRGASWNFDATYIYASYRRASIPASKGNGLGVRCARSP